MSEKEKNQKRRNSMNLTNISVRIAYYANIEYVCMYVCMYARSFVNRYRCHSVSIYLSIYTIVYTYKTCLFLTLFISLYLSLSIYIYITGRKTQQADIELLYIYFSYSLHM